MASSPHDVTRLLGALGAGDRSAFDALLPLVYDELRSIARRHLHRERGDHTLSTTALVHEAYLRLVDQSQLRMNGRAHFFAVAAIAMRRIEPKRLMPTWWWLQTLTPTVWVLLLKILKVNLLILGSRLHRTPREGIISPISL